MNYIRIAIDDNLTDVQIEYDGAGTIGELKLQLEAAYAALDEAEADPAYMAQRTALEQVH